MKLSSAINLRSGTKVEVDRVENNDHGKISHHPIKIKGKTYSKGISFHIGWDAGIVSTLEYQFEPQFTSFACDIGISDHVSATWYEWQIVKNGQLGGLKRPPDGFNGVEQNDFTRIGAGASAEIFIKKNGAYSLVGDTKMMYRYKGNAVTFDIDMKGVSGLKFVGKGAHYEELEAPYRKNLKTRVLVNIPWNDFITLGNAALTTGTSEIVVNQNLKPDNFHLSTGNIIASGDIKNGKDTYTILGQKSGRAGYRTSLIRIIPSQR